MREIKFRAWDKRHNRFIVLEKIHFGENGPKGVYERNELSPTTPYIYSIEWIELMAYTGLKDKNGKEIYEGDIVSLKYLYDKRTTDKGQVVWREDKASFGLKSLKGLTNEVYELYQVTAEHNLEIIGNIYENKELLDE